MEFFRIKHDIPFMRHALVFNIISLVTFLLAVISLSTKGLHFGVDFTGGTVMEVHYAKDVPDLDKIRERVAKLGYTDVAVQNFGTSRDVMMRLPLTKNEDNTRTADNVMYGLALPDFGGKVEAAVDKGAARVTREAAMAKMYATEAAQRARSFAYDKLGWTTAISCIDPENLPSQRVAQRLGAKREGHMELRGSMIVSEMALAMKNQSSPLRKLGRCFLVSGRSPLSTLWWNGSSVERHIALRFGYSV